MPKNGFKDFLLKRMLVTYLTLIPSAVGVAVSILGILISPSLLSFGVFSVTLILVLTGTMVMYRKFEEERLVESTRKLNIFVEEFNDRIGNLGYIYSLPSIALEIARNKRVLGDTQAWNKLLTKLSEDLANNGSGLTKRIEADEEQFKAHLNDFRKILASLREFKKSFYEMLSEARHLIVYYSNAEFRNRHEEASEEYNRYMDKLKIFSDEIKARFKESLDDNLTEHVKGNNELFPNLGGAF